MTANHNATRLGIVGIGGYASSIAELVLTHGDQCQPPVKLVACSDPDAEEPALAPRVDLLKSAGVNVTPDNNTIIEAQDIDALWLPLPIHLHRSLSEQAARAGKSVMCEKPAAGCLDDVDAMIRARDQHQTQTLIGFQDIYEPHVIRLKQELLAGTYGEILTATVVGCWPRPIAYFKRNQWAGRTSIPSPNGDEPIWIRDSPLNNAMSHFVHQALFYLGQAEHENVSVTGLNAQCYRVNAIESFDTILARATTSSPTPCPLTILLSHAAAETLDPKIILRCSKATIRKHYHRIEITWNDGKKQDLTPDWPYRKPMLQTLSEAVHSGGRHEAVRLGVSLEMAREHTKLVEMVDHVQTTATIDEQDPRHVVVDGQDQPGSDQRIRTIEGIGPRLMRLAEDAIAGRPHPIRLDD